MASGGRSWKDLSRFDDDDTYELVDTSELGVDDVVERMERPVRLGPAQRRT